MNLAWVHIDEKRAFLAARYKGEKEVYTKHVGSRDWYKVIGALYGLKTSPKDYQSDVIARLSSMQFIKLPTSNCVFIKIINQQEFVLVYDFVDDFIVIGNTQQLIEEHFIVPFRKVASTTEPIYNPVNVLGMEIERIESSCIVLLTMKQRIVDLAEVCNIDSNTRKRSTPMPVSGYKLEESFPQNSTSEDDMYLPPEQIQRYMQIVGSLVWISGIRYDISFAVLYLSWHTKQPRKHHLNMALYVVTYLYYTKDVPLVLGGKSDISLTTYTDSSLATGPKRRSISGQLTKLNESSGAIHVKSHATESTCMSTFESELSALTDGMKTALYLQHLLSSLNTDIAMPATIYADNKAMLDFVNGEGSLRGSRHMDLRLWFS